MRVQRVMQNGAMVLLAAILLASTTLALVHAHDGLSGRPCQPCKMGSFAPLLPPLALLFAPSALFAWDVFLTDAPGVTEPLLSCGLSRAPPA